MRKGLPIFLLAAILVLTGCDSRNGIPDQDLPIDAWLPLTIGDKEILAQIAIQPHEQRRGLMYREVLEENSGMLFAYRAPRRVSFYMKNTPLPLDIGFFDENGVLKEIHRMMPYDTTSTVSTSDQIQFALEMHQGWYSRNQLFPGSRLDLDQVARALSMRGADPRLFGLQSEQ